MSSTDSTTIGVHRALHEALNSAREARHRLDDGDATPDLDDLVELGTLVAGLSEAVVAMVAHGLSNDEIAAAMVLSPTTAKTHVSRAMIKLGAHDRAQLVVFAYQTGLVTPRAAGLRVSYVSFGLTCLSGGTEGVAAPSRRRRCARFPPRPAWRHQDRPASAGRWPAGSRRDHERDRVLSR